MKNENFNFKKFTSLVEAVELQNDSSIKFVSSSKESLRIAKELFPDYEIVKAPDCYFDDDTIYIIPTEKDKEIKFCDNRKIN